MSLNIILFSCNSNWGLSNKHALTLKLLRDRSKFEIKFCFPPSFKTAEFLADVLGCNSLTLAQRKYT